MQPGIGQGHRRGLARAVDQRLHAVQRRGNETHVGIALTRIRAAPARPARGRPAGRRTCRASWSGGRRRWRARLRASGPSPSAMPPADRPSREAGAAAGHNGRGRDLAGSARAAGLFVAPHAGEQGLDLGRDGPRPVFLQPRLAVVRAARRRAGTTLPRRGCARRQAGRRGDPTSSPSRRPRPCGA